MQTSRRPVTGRVGALLALVMVVSMVAPASGVPVAPANAQPSSEQDQADPSSGPPQLFVPAAGVGELPIDPEVTTRHRYVGADLSLLPNPVVPSEAPDPEIQERLELELFEDVTYTAVLDRTQEVARGVVSWIGGLKEDENGRAVLVVVNGILSGTVDTSDETYRIQHVADDVYEIAEMDHTAFPVHEEPAHEPERDVHEEGDDAGSMQQDPEPADEIVQIDVLVVYTEKVKDAWGGTSSTEAQIGAGIAEANQSFVDSDVHIEFRLVHTAEVDYTESGTIGGDLDNLKSGDVDNAHALRDEYGADLLALVAEEFPDEVDEDGDPTSYCGIAKTLVDLDASDNSEAKAFSVTKRSCVRAPTWSFTHELGHNLGAQHDRYVVDDDKNTVFPYTRAYVQPDYKWRTMMAYWELCDDNNESCPRKSIWSNPDKDRSGDPTGVPEGEEDSADNAKTLNNTRTTVAAYRAPAVDPPDLAKLIAPEGSVPDNGITFRWEPAAEATDYKLTILRPDGTTAYAQWFTAKDAACPNGDEDECSLDHPTLILPGGEGYHWFIRTANGDEVAAYSTGLRFDLGPAPLVVDDARDVTSSSLCTGSYPCTLRAAIERANEIGGPHNIRFDIDPPGPHTISPREDLPAITTPIHIDGTSQPSGEGCEMETPCIEISGDRNSSSPSAGLRLAGGARASRIEGLAINAGHDDGIRVTTSRTQIVGNRIGTDRAGERGSANGYGIQIVGVGATDIEGNLISANDNSGIRISGTNGWRNRIADNLIGTTADGLDRLGNIGAGVFLDDVSENRVGVRVVPGEGLVPAGNVISGNAGGGVTISGSGAFDNEVVANLIGTNAFGTEPIGNDHCGVCVSDAPDNMIGRGGEWGNVISGNWVHGVRVTGDDATGNRVRGNSIGLSPHTISKFPNVEGHGVLLKAPGNTVGGTDGQGNFISANQTEEWQGDGVRIEGSSDGSWNASANEVLGNTIGTNEAGSTSAPNTYGVMVSDSAGNRIGGGEPGEGNHISGNDRAGVYIRGAGSSGNVILGNLIGISFSSFTLTPNGLRGIDIFEASDTTIGGVSLAAVHPRFDDLGPANVISHNGGPGVWIEGTESSPATGNVLLGNHIGTDSGGTKALPNDGAGVLIERWSRRNTVGGTERGEGNVISGNEKDGVALVGQQGSDVSENAVLGNRIGIDVGNDPLPNDRHGVLIRNASANTVGGTEEGAGNVISANTSDGVNITTASDVRAGVNDVQGNRIGTDVAGLRDRGNRRHGVHILRSRGNVVGGLEELAPNQIAFNGGDGIRVMHGSAVANFLLHNNINQNGGLGIDLGGDGVTENDDETTGPNRSQNFPVLGEVESDEVRGKLVSVPDEEFWVELYTVPECDPSGHGEGGVFLTATKVKTDENGEAPVTLPLSDPLEPRQIVTATAIRIAAGDTSEFSACAELLTPPSPPRNVDLEPGNKQLVVSWDPPEDDGGSDIISYEALSKPDGVSCTATPPDTTCVLEDLTNNVEHQVIVRAENEAGVSDESDPLAVGVPHLPVTDFSADGETDVSIYRNSNGTWYIRDFDNVTWGVEEGDIPVPGDYTGRGDTDIAVYRPSNGVWYIKGGLTVRWGIQDGDVPVPGDYTGDGMTDIAIYRPSNGRWYIHGIQGSVRWGVEAGDVPVPGDYDGDGKTDIAVFRPRTGTWYVRGVANVRWGVQRGDVPVPGDYDGDGTTDIAVFRPSNGTWYVRDQYTARWGVEAGDVPVPGDYDGNGTWDVAVYRPSNGVWYVRDQFHVRWGIQEGDVPLSLPHAIRYPFFDS